MKKLLDLKIKAFLLILIFFIPFASLILELLEAKTTFGESAVFWITHWYEPAAVVLLALILIINVVCRKLNCSWSVVLAGVLVALGIGSVFFLSESVSFGIEGFRFSLFALLIYILISQVEWKKNQHKLPINLYLIVASIISIWALIERMLPLNYWQKVLGEDSTFGWGNFSIVVATQSSSVMQGPNQLASFLLPAVFIVLVSLGFLKSRDFESKILRFLLLSLFIATIIFTFSRAALVALVFGLIVYSLISFIRSKESSTILRYFIPVVLIILAIGSYYIYQNNRAVNDYFTHGQSQSQHVLALKDSLGEMSERTSQITKFTFGSGLGTAGPLAIKYGEGFVSESWYLQVALELGMVGLLLWLATVVFIAVEQQKADRQGLFLSLISVSIAAIFLHTFADNPAVSIVLFGLLGTLRKIE